MDARGAHTAVTHIRDPIHGEIGVSQLEYDLLDSPPVQRLRQIAQLGAVKRVYPSATHSRFTHSLGVMHLAGLLANAVGLSDQRVTETRLAGLLHDTGHGPFSHTSERLIGGAGSEHETRSLSIADRLCDDLPVDTAFVSQQIAGAGSPNLVAGVIDADRLDYLLRDSLFTAVDHGLVDVQSLVRFSDTIDGTLAFDGKAIPSLTSFLSARLRMRTVVYRYPTVRQFDTLLFYALRDYADRVGVNKLVQMTDDAVRTGLVNHNNAFYEQLRQREFPRTRLSLGTADLSQQTLTVLSQSPHDEIAGIVRAELNSQMQSDSILVSRPYTPAPLSETPIIGADTTAPLTHHSALPDSITREAWNNTSLTLYGPFEDPVSQQTRESIAARLTAELPDTVGE